MQININTPFLHFWQRNHFFLFHVKRRFQNYMASYFDILNVFLVKCTFLPHGELHTTFTGRSMFECVEFYTFNWNPCPRVLCRRRRNKGRETTGMGTVRIPTALPAFQGQFVFDFCELQSIYDTAKRVRILLPSSIV